MTPSRLADAERDEIYEIVHFCLRCSRPLVRGQLLDSSWRWFHAFDFDGWRAPEATTGTMSCYG